MSASPPSKRQKPDSKCEAVASPSFFASYKIHVVQAGIGKARTEIFRKQIKKYDGSYVDTYNNSKITHMIVDDEMELDRLCRILKIEKPPDPSKIAIVKSLWLSTCIRTKSLVETKDYELNVEKYIKQLEREKRLSDITTVEGKEDSSNLDSKMEPGNNSAYQKRGMMFGMYKKVPDVNPDEGADSDYEPSGDECEEEQVPTPSTSKDREPPLPKGNWVCARSSDVSIVNHNKNITEKLEAMAKTYENTNDKWRALGYQKAIAALKKYPHPISSFEEAKALSGVGNRLAEKIWEIIESGGLRKLDNLSSSEEIQAINLFTNIWGAGPTTARAWVAQGHRTLDDLRTKASLTRHQQIGLRLYDDIMDRMPREEAAEIEAVVKDAATSILPGVLAMACGSYRRGKKTCGDVDVLITHSDGKAHKGLFSQVLNCLRESGFLTDDLVQQEDSGNQKKYLGVCKLPGENRRHRRLDVIVVPYDEFACALMYFTGSAHFNRSMRNLASKMGMSLSEHALCAGVVRSKGEKLNKGVPLPTPTEESVFKHLGLQYRSPEERDH